MTLSLLHDQPIAAELPNDSRGRRAFLQKASAEAATPRIPSTPASVALTADTPTGYTGTVLSASAGCPAPEPVDTAHWGGVFAMTLCVFALIASEFMPVSLLTPIASDLRVSEGLAGYGIAISGAFAVLTSLSISVVAGSMNRKTLL